ncbi:hypothetical protein [Allofournierella sp.]|uniref:hypothetical protein n=1 Tax=Allofournierella sp. TaxID=1940256 RepID=UPI003AB6AA4F
MIHFNYPHYPLQWYRNANPVSGNAGQFNYKVLRQGGELAAWCWMGVWCMEKTKDVKERRFAFPDKQEQEQQESVDQAIAWLREEFDAHSRAEIEARDGFFTTGPYTPPAPEPPQE